MTFEFKLYRPGVEYNRKREPVAYPPEIADFEAPSNTAALNIARSMYKQIGLGPLGHFNISKTGE